MTMTSSPPHARKRRRLTPQQIRDVASRASCYPQAVERFLDGKKQWSTTVSRIEKAMKELGLS
jgi:DNA-binding LacI/PurR family transcriptional regulator